MVRVIVKTYTMSVLMVSVGPSGAKSGSRVGHVQSHGVQGRHNGGHGYGQPPGSGPWWWWWGEVRITVGCGGPGLRHDSQGLAHGLGQGLGGTGPGPGYYGRHNQDQHPCIHTCPTSKQSPVSSARSGLGAVGQCVKPQKGAAKQELASTRPDPVSPRECGLVGMVSTNLRQGTNSL